MRTAPALVAVAIALCLGALAPAPAQADVVTDWNAITLNCVQGGTTQANRLGPPGLLDIALVQAAVHDAVQAVEGRYRPYHYEAPDRRGRGSAAAAAAAAAYHALAGLYGADDACLAGVGLPADRYPGDAALATGRAAALALLPLYRPTVALPSDPWLGSDAAGQWRPTSPGTSGASTFLAVTAPFAMKRPDQFRPAPPPRLTSLVYRWDYDEAAARFLGVDAELGTLEAGKKADLVVVSGDPLASVDALREPLAVVADGAWWPVEALRAPLSATAAWPPAH